MTSKIIRNVHLWGLAILIFAFLGCEELDFSNPNSPDLSSANVQSLVSGAEGFMRSELDVYLQSVGTLGREIYFFEPADPRFTGELIFGPVDPGGFLSTRPWDQAYRVVFNCNELLNRTADVSGAEAAGIEGFARTIRAYQLLLVLGYVDEDAQGRSIRLNFDGDLSVPFATKAEAFEFIVNDLDEGFAALGNAGSSFSFSLSSGFAGFDTPASFAQFNRAIKARAEVRRDGFSAALEALGQSFLDPGGDLNRGVYHVYSTAANDRTNPVFEIPTSAGLKLHAHMSFEADAEAGDQRLANKTFKRPAIDRFDGLDSDLAVILNFEPASTYSSTSKFPIIRNEELILLRAEANVGLGNFGAAEADMNIVRAAAGLPDYTGTDASNALDRVLHEKRYSLFGEGHRWIDMRHYGRLDQLPIDRPDRGDRVIPRMQIPETEFQEN